MSDEAIEVEAEVIEAPAKRTAVDGLVQKAVELESAIGRGDTYHAHEIADYADYQQSKRERTALRRDMKAINDEKIRLFRIVDEQKRRISDALRPAKEADEAYKAQIDAYEARVVSNRLQEAKEHYEDFAPDLVTLVPFERIDAKYGKAGKWHAFGANIQTIDGDVQEIVKEIARTERLIDAQAYGDEDKARLKALYFAYLDFGQAAAQAQQEKEQREGVARLEQERRERAAEQERIRQHAEWVAQAAESQRQAQAAAMPEQSADVPESAGEPAQAAQVQKAAVCPQAVPQAATEAHRRPRRIARWHVSCSEEHAGEVINALKSIPTCRGEFMGWKIAEE